MSAAVFFAVLFAAALHAGWNALVKVGLDRFSSILLMALAQIGLSLALLPFFPPPNPVSWSWILASAAIHTSYKLFLIKAYEHGDLSLVYPLARGTAPLIVAVVSLTVLGEAMTVEKILAVSLIGGGICLMPVSRGGVGSLSPKAFGFALVTAGCTAPYTLVDGIGARLSGSASGFILTATIVDGMFTCACGAAARGRRAFVRLAPAWRTGVTAGAMSLASYWVVIWAFTQAPIALVAALRETSVLFALLIAILVLKERVGPGRIVAAALIACGIVLMRI